MGSIGFYARGYCLERQKGWISPFSPLHCDHCAERGKKGKRRGGGISHCAPAHEYYYFPRIVHGDPRERDEEGDVVRGCSAYFS